MLLDTLKVHDTLTQFRIGANGVDRQGTINYYFKQMINIYVPAFHRYMMWIADSQTELFGEKNKECGWLDYLREEASHFS